VKGTTEHKRENINHDAHLDDDGSTMSMFEQEEY